MRIHITGLRGEGKSYLAVLLMRLLQDFPYTIKYHNFTRAQEKDRIYHLEEIENVPIQELVGKMKLGQRILEIYDVCTDDTNFKK